MFAESPRSRLAQLIEEMKNIVDNMGPAKAPEPFGHEIKLVGFQWGKTSAVRHTIPKNEDLIGNIKVTVPKVCKVELTIDEAVEWSSETEPGVPLKIPMTLDMSKLANHVTQILVHDIDPADTNVTVFGHVEKNLAERALLCRQPRNGKWYQVETPARWCGDKNDYTSRLIEELIKRVDFGYKLHHCGHCFDDEEEEDQDEEEGDDYWKEVRDEFEKYLSTYEQQSISDTEVVTFVVQCYQKKSRPLDVDYLHRIVNMCLHMCGDKNDFRTRLADYVMKKISPAETH